MEEFKTIIDYPTYQISNLGNVKNKKNKILKHISDQLGYKSVHLCINGKPTRYKIHRLVAIHFLEMFDNKPNVDHIDGDPTNNNLNNLRWCSQQENVRNKRKNTKNISGFRGVHFCKSRKKWVASVWENSKRKQLGYFDTIEEAILNRQIVAKEIYGDFYSER